jgi:predicted nucleic acid-binding Zn ribbon protein
MLKLSNALHGWQPSDHQGAHDPVVLLTAGWNDIVGDDVAANSAPLRIANGTLLVVVPSSAWSHQLSFLSERIVSAVAERLPAAGVERLRFRVGTLPKRGRGGRRGAAPSPAKTIAEREPSGSAEEALARFAQTVHLTQQARRAGGWRDCDRCGALGETNRCVPCESAVEEARSLATIRLLFEAPWLGYAGTADLVDGLCEVEYERVRRRVLRRWWGQLEQARAAGRISRDGRERLIASSYILLRSKLPPERIAPATVRSLLGDELNTLLYGDEQNG